MYIYIYIYIYISVCARGKVYCKQCVFHLNNFNLHNLPLSGLPPKEYLHATKKMSCRLNGILTVEFEFTVSRRLRLRLECG